MVIPKSKRKQRQFFIELNYLEKVNIKEADRLIASGYIGSVIRGIDGLIRQHGTRGIKILAKRAPSIKNDDILSKWFNKHREWVWVNKHQYKTRPLIELNPNPNNFAVEDFHDSLEDEGCSIGYGNPSKQDFELEDEEWDATYQAAYGTKVIEFQEDHS